MFGWENGGRRKNRFARSDVLTAVAVTVVTERYLPTFRRNLQKLDFFVFTRKT
jgi:hypothetical protein